MGRGLGLYCIKEGEDMTEKKYILPMIPLRGLTIFPYMVLHFDIGREKSIRALEEAFMKNQLIFVTTQKEAEIEDPSIDDVYKVGTITKVKQMLKLPGELIRVLVEGISRAEIQQVTRDDEFFEVEVIEKEEQKEIEKTPELEALMRSVISAFEEYVNMTSRLPIDSLYSVISIEEPGRLADMIAAHISLNTNQSQQLLECFDVNKRLETLLGFLMKELEILNIEREINAKVRSQIDKLQKEYYLREQLKAIKAELGETDEIDQEIEEYEKKINEKDYPKRLEKRRKRN